MDSNQQNRDHFRTLNSEGGRKRHIFAVPILVFMMIGFWYPGAKGDPEVIWVGRILLPILLAWVIYWLINITTVEISKNSIRVKKRKHIVTIPFEDIEKVNEGLMGRGGLYPNSPRTVTVYLRKEYPIGRKFSFQSIAEYGIFDKESGEAKVLKERIKPDVE